MSAGTKAAELDSVPKGSTQFLNDHLTRAPSAHTVKEAYHQDFVANVTTVASGDP
jgi:hypothetical protein